MKAPLPFDTRVLRDTETNDFDALLPATHRTASDHIVTPQPHDLKAFLSRELLVPRLNSIHAWLWVCGRPMPPRPLHRQVLMSRSIVVAEEMELHLVWEKNRIFVKPVPAYLLDPDFWTANLLSGGGESVADRQNDLAACARGFLFSYTALISYESDFTIARQCGLLPSSVTWAGWKTLCAQLLSSHCYSAVNPRYWYGELRLGRLNKVYIFRKGFILRGYSSVGGYAMYDDLLRDNFTALAAALGYVVIVLTAMQVALATDRLQPNRAFQNASFGFSVFSIIAPLIAAAGIVAGVLCMFVSNWAATKRYESRRFREMGVEPFGQGRRQSGGGPPSH